MEIKSRINYDALPASLRKNAGFCCWKYEATDKGHITKVPYNPITGHRTTITDPSVFTTYDNALKAVGKYDGLGVGIYGNIAGIDIDNCIDNDSLSPLAQDVYDTMKAYTEKSPSGTGIRILFTVPEGFEYNKIEYYIKNPSLHIETYVPGMTKRFLTLTGDTLTPGMDLAERGDELMSVIEKYMHRPGKKSNPTEQQSDAGQKDLNASSDNYLSDTELLDKALNSKDYLFIDLFNGRWEEHYTSPSEADIALCEKLAFWTGRDAGQIDRLFRQSALMRSDKWSRDDYRENTIQKAISLCSNIYVPSQSLGSGGKETSPESHSSRAKTISESDDNHDNSSSELKHFDSLEPEYIDGPESEYVDNSESVHIDNPDGVSNEEPAESTESDTVSVPDFLSGQDKSLQKFHSYIVGNYITDGAFSKDIDYFKRYQNRKTGFANIDEYLTLYPGMVALGGIASLGKTTFCVNLADNLVKAGETVLYFALEQEPIELVTKSLTRRLYEKDRYNHLTNIDIKNGATSDTLEEVKKEYAADSERFIIIRSNFSTTAIEIRDFVESFIKSTGIRPVVFIDYLQLIAPQPSFRGDTRAALDDAIKLFKNMQMQNELLLILVSNFNRSSYNTPASYEDFKETGMIEYTCDYIWALQLSILEDDTFYSKSASKSSVKASSYDIDKKVHEAINCNPKEVEFVSLKNRNGKQSFKCFFNYYMEQDRFDADLDSKYIKKDPAAKTINLTNPGGHRTVH